MPQKVVVTAAASGIGAAIAQAFLADGAEVFICDIDEAGLRSAVDSHDRMHGQVCDVSDPAAVKGFVEAAAAALRGIDVLVNNAGISGPTKPVADLPVQDWQTVLNVNLTGTFVATQAAIPHLTASDNGHVLCMSSVGGRFGYQDRSAYAVTKRGIIAFVETLAIELGGQGVRANAIAPGAVDGDRIRRVMQGRAEARGISVEKATELALGVQSLKRFVDPADIGELAVFLSSNAARSISGQTIAIDGDSHAAS